jgi:CII-binding regulator of phage lambda lysogenization HflD
MSETNQGLNSVRIETKLDEHTEILYSIERRLDRYNDQLEIHIRRSDALETKVGELYKFKYYVVGALSILTAMLTFGLDLIKEYLTRK